MLSILLSIMILLGIVFFAIVVGAEVVYQIAMNRRSARMFGPDVPVMRDQRKAA
jgi:hypothetical protein